MPVLISPTGVQAVHPDGEVAVARAAAARGTAMGLSSFGSKPIDEVIAATDLCDVDELRRRRLGASRGLVGLIGPAALPARGAPHACTALGEYCDGSGSVDTAVSEPTSGAGLLPLPAMS